MKCLRPSVSEDRRPITLFVETVCPHFPDWSVGAASGNNVGQWPWSHRPAASHQLISDNNSRDPDEPSSGQGRGTMTHDRDDELKPRNGRIEIRAAVYVNDYPRGKELPSKRDKFVQ